MKLKYRFIMVTAMILTAGKFSAAAAKDDPVGLSGIRTKSQVFDVSEYGAKGDGITDDTVAIQKTVVALLQSGNGATLIFPKGRYNVKDADTLIAIEKLDNITIDGQGSEIVPLNRRMNVLSVNKSKNITIKNLTIYWDKPFFSQAKVIASTAKSLDIKVADNYPVSGMEKIEALMDYDPATKMPIAKLDLFGSAIVEKKIIAPQTLRLVIKDKWGQPGKSEYVAETLSTMPVGTAILLRHAIYGQYAMDINLCENVLLENIKIWGVPGMAIHMTQCQDVRVSKLIVEPKPGTDRMMSTTGDAFFIMFPMGELLIENTRIEGSGDDCLPINGKYLKVAEIVDNSTVNFKVEIGWPGPVPRPGDKIDFYNDDNLIYKTTLTVAGGHFDPREKCHVVKFKDKLPEIISVGDAAYNSAFACSKITVKNTVLGANRSRATILSARNILFDNVKIHNTGLAGAMVFGDKGRSHRPGPSAENVTFKNCVFDSCALAPLIVYTGAPHPGKAQKNINVIDCKFTENENIKKLRVKSANYPDILFYQAAIYYRDVDQGNITGNSFEGYRISMFLGNTDAVTVKDNKCLDPQPSKILAGPNSNPGLTLSGNTNFTEDKDVSKYNASYLYYTDMR